MIELIVNRMFQDDVQTVGLLTVGGFSCKTLELSWKQNRQYISRIPESEYIAIPHVSPKFGNSIWVLDVSGRSEILTHYGNFYSNTLGCILVGRNLFDIDGDGHVDVTHSRTTMEQLYDIIRFEKQFIFKIINTAPSSTGLY